MKFKKTAALTGAVLLTCALLAGCGVKGQQPLEQTTLAGEIQTNTFDITQPFQNIQVECAVSDVRVLPTPGGAAVGCTNLPGLEYSARVEGDTLIVREEGETTAEGAEILICLPKPDFEALEISTVSGNVDVPLDFRFTDVTLTAVSGELSYRAQASGAMTCKTDSGRILITDATPTGLTLESGSGRIEAQSLQVEGNLTVSSGSGAVNFSHVRCENAKVSTASGELSLEQLLAGGNMGLTSQSGNVTLTACDGGTVTVTTDSGSVTGTLQTDKTFTVTSDSGTVSVPDTTGGDCVITTASGDVTLTIGGAA